MLRAILMLGNGGGGPGDNWFPYLERELPELGTTVTNKEFPDLIEVRVKRKI